MAKLEPSEQAIRLRKFLDIVNVKSIDLAADLNLTRSTISRYLSGDLEPSTNLLRHLRTKYKMSYDWYFDGTGSPRLNAKEKLSVTVLNELASSIELVLKRQSMMEGKVNKLVRDVYAK